MYKARVRSECTSCYLLRLMFFFYLLLRRIFGAKTSLWPELLLSRSNGSFGVGLWSSCPRVLVWSVVPIVRSSSGSGSSNRQVVRDRGIFNLAPTKGLVRHRLMVRDRRAVKLAPRGRYEYLYLEMSESSDSWNS